MSEAQTYQSLSGATWQEAPSVLPDAQTKRLAQHLQQAHNIPIAIAMHLARHGVTSESLDDFLEPRLRNSLPDPLVMRDADKAIGRICDAIEEGHPIGLFGDYDVDGACSAALFRQVLGQFGIPVYCHIPDRFSEGYGPNITALKQLKEKGARLIITVDCGITAHEPLAEAAEQNMDVLVIDHHKAGPTLPVATAVVNPNRLDDDSRLGYLCAAGVCFLVLAGVMRECRTRNITPPSGTMPDLLTLLDMVGLATVCDVVPLRDVNRVFVKQGLKMLATRQNLGLRHFCDVAGLAAAPTTHTLGFLLGPRINAGGRLGQSDLGIQLLTAQDGDIAGSLALRLDELNVERRATEQAVQLQAEALAEEQLTEDAARPVLILSGQGWHEGVIGIVAGRLKDKYNRPVIVIAFDDEGRGKGSGRGVPGLSLGDVIQAARQDGLLLSGGGHDMAAGLSLHRDKLAAFTSFVNGRASAAFGDAPPKRSFVASHTLSVAGCTSDITDWLEKVGPFGVGHPEPRFIITHCQLKNLRWVGAEKQHLSVQLDDKTARPLSAICFSAATTPLGRALAATPDPGLVSVLGRVRVDSFRGGGAVQLHIEDIAIG